MSSGLQMRGPIEREIYVGTKVPLCSDANLMLDVHDVRGQREM